MQCSAKTALKWRKRKEKKRLLILHILSSPENFQLQIPSYCGYKYCTQTHAHNSSFWVFLYFDSCYPGLHGLSYRMVIRIDDICVHCYLVVQCARSEIKTLYLARFLLELSLMEYKFVFHRESMLAASCLYVARRMRGEGGWVSCVLPQYTSC